MCGITSLENLDSFVEQMLSGELKPYLKSEPIPTSNEGPVKVSIIRNHCKLGLELTWMVVIFQDNLTAKVCYLPEK